MKRQASRFWRMMALFSFTIVMAGCFQAASEEPEAPPPPAVGQVSSPTPDLPVETATIEPAGELTGEPGVGLTSTPEPFIEPTLDVGPVLTETPTLDTNSLFPATDTPAPVIPAATATPTLMIVALGTPTAPVGDVNALPPEQVVDPLQATPTLRPALGTATAIIATDIAQDALATREAQNGVPGDQPPLFVTSTPFGPGLATLSPNDGAFTTQPPLATEPFLATQSGPVVAPGNCLHTVAAGDNLFRISLRYGVSIDAIAAANPTKITTIQIIVVGDQLVIPGCNTGGNPGIPQDPPQGTCNPDVPGSYRFVHNVRQYETLFGISLQYGSTVNDIAACNNIPNINLIYISQTLYIP